MKRRPIYYCLDADGKTPVPWDGDVIEWAERLHKTRCVALDRVDEIAVSTIFLGLDCQWMPDSPPLLFETALLPAEENGGYRLARCSTFEQAMIVHSRALVQVATEDAERKRIAQDVIKRLVNSR